MRYFIFLWVLFFQGCSYPNEDQFEKCIKQKVEKDGTKLVYFLQTKQKYLNNDLLLKKIKVTLQLPDGSKVNRKDSILFRRKKDGTWSCTLD